jgi:hypothetical protein
MSTAKRYSILAEACICRRMPQWLYEDAYRRKMLPQQSGTCDDQRTS